MKRLSASVFRSVVLSFFFVTLFVVLLFYRDVHLPPGVRDGLRSAGQLPLGTFEFGRVGKESRVTERLDMKEKECRKAFPELFKEIDSAVGRGQFKFEKSPADYKGLVQGRIKDNKLYIHTTAPDTIPQILHQRTSILSQLHRALTTSPCPLPDTPFAFVINDSPKNNSWSFSRPNKPSTYTTFLMPSFAFWSWPSPTLGTPDAVLARIHSVEASTPWASKRDKLVWRGTPFFNPLGNPTLRPALLKATAHKLWADVQALNVSNGQAVNALPIEDFCRYKYVVYTEGVTYSGRLPYHQACESVLVTPPLTHITHTAWLMRPIFASELLASFSSSSSSTTSSSTSSTDTKPPQALLPTVHTWHDATAIYIDPTFSNLEPTITFLRQHPEVAQRIARNQRRLVADKGYLSAAAETCYWRGLVRGWAGVARVDEEEWAGEGERFETWLLGEVVEGRGGGTRGRNG